MNEEEKKLAGELLPCPHCGERPWVFAMRKGDRRMREDEFINYCVELGDGKTPIYRVGCCFEEYHTDWQELRDMWNRRQP